MLPVEIVAVHVDAVLETPYYTIELPDGTRRNALGDNLTSSSKCDRTSGAVDSAERVRRRDAMPRDRSASGTERRVRSSSDKPRRRRASSRGEERGGPRTAKVIENAVLK